MKYKKSVLGQTEMEYLGLWVTRTGIRPVNKNRSRYKIKPPKNQKHVHSFIVILNDYRDMWYKWSHLLQPLTALTSNKVKSKCTGVEKNCSVKLRK